MEIKVMLFQIIEYYANNCEKGINNMGMTFVPQPWCGRLWVYLFIICIYKISTYCIYLILGVDRVRI